MEELSLPFRVDRLINALRKPGEPMPQPGTPAYPKAMQHAIDMLEARFCNDRSLGRVDVRPDGDFKLCYDLSCDDVQKVVETYQAYESALQFRAVSRSAPEYPHYCAIDMELRQVPDFDKAHYFFGEWLKSYGYVLLRAGDEKRGICYRIGEPVADKDDGDMHVRLVEHPQMASELAMVVLLNDRLDDFVRLHQRTRIFRARLMLTYSQMKLQGATEWNTRMLGRA